MHISKHAGERMAERGVSRRDVARGLKGNVRLVPSRTRPGTAWALCDGGLALVVDAHTGDLVTAMWEN